VTTSGTYAFAPDMAEIIEEAYERAGLELRTGYDLKTAIRSLNFLMVEWANRGLNLWTIEEVQLPVTSGTNVYTLDAQTIDVIESVVRDNDNDIKLERIGLGSWAAISNKTQTGRPYLVYVERLVGETKLNLWPVPDASYTVVYWRLKRMQDAGGAVSDPDVPFRFLPALVAGLAYMIAMKRPEASARAPDLKAVYEEAFNLAADEDRDRSSAFFFPDLR
jgi:hypothetical protein